MTILVLAAYSQIHLSISYSNIKHHKIRGMTKDNSFMHHGHNRWLKQENNELEPYMSSEHFLMLNKLSLIQNPNETNYQKKKS